MKINSKKKRRIALRIVLVFVLTVLTLAALIANRFIPQDVADYYSAKIFPYLSVPAQTFNMLFHFSLTENIIVCFVPLIIVGLIFWFVILIKKFLSRGALLYLYKSYRNIMVLALVAAIIFQAMHGINYRRTDVVDSIELTDEELTYEDYCEALRWAYIGMIEARKQLGEDYNGVAHMQESFESSALYACSLIDAFGEEYGVPVSENYVRAKPVSMSHYWSYTYIVGAYDPFLSEANINTDHMGVEEFPITLCHELCHAKGYASETDCNTLSTLACCNSTRADFRYAGFYEVFWNLYAVTTVIADATGEVVPQYALASDMEPVYRDMRASSLYWKQIDKEVDSIKESLGIDITETSDKVNDSFLKSNGESGVDSYHVPDSVYVRFYKTYVRSSEDA